MTKINVFERKEFLIDTLNMIEESLSPFIGQFDPKKFIWSTFITIGHFDGETWTNDQHTQYAELNAELDRIRSQRKGIMISDPKIHESGTTRNIQGSGLHLIEKLPITIIPFTSQIQFHFGSNSDQTGEFLITPILVYLQGGNEIEYQFGNISSHGFYGEAIESDLVKLVSRHIFTYFKTRTEPFLNDAIISVNRHRYSISDLKTINFSGFFR